MEPLEREVPAENWLLPCSLGSHFPNSSVPYEARGVCFRVWGRQHVHLECFLRVFRSPVRLGGSLLGSGAVILDTCGSKWEQM